MLPDIALDSRKPAFPQAFVRRKSVKRETRTLVTSVTAVWHTTVVMRWHSAFPVDSIRIYLRIAIVTPAPFRRAILLCNRSIMVLGVKRTYSFTYNILKMYHVVYSSKQYISLQKESILVVILVVYHKTKCTTYTKLTFPVIITKIILYIKCYNTTKICKHLIIKFRHQSLHIPLVFQASHGYASPRSVRIFHQLLCILLHSGDPYILHKFPQNW